MEWKNNLKYQISVCVLTDRNERLLYQRPGADNYAPHVCARYGRYWPTGTNGSCLDMIFISYLPRMKAALFITIFFGAYALQAQSPQDLKLPESKRFIDKIEIFAGPNLSFNYGNMFIENYNDDNVTNKRLLKSGYAFGLGVYHPIKDRLYVNMRFLYEEKGTNSEMITPGLQINSKYIYKYLSASIAPRVLFGKNKKLALSFGIYFSRIQSAKGDITVLDRQNDQTFISSFYGRQVRELRPDGSTASISIGFGYSLNISQKSSATIYIADNLGLLNINKPVIIVNNLNPIEKNHNISLLIGYILKRPFKK
jgi:hypothetical protein